MSFRLAERSEPRAKSRGQREISDNLWRPFFLVLGGFALIVALGGVYYQAVLAPRDVQLKPGAYERYIGQKLYQAPVPEVERFYRRYDCGYTLRLLPDWKVEERGMLTAAIVSGERGVRIVCAEEIPDLPLPPERIEELALNGVTAKIYHDASSRDGTLEDDLRVRHPTLPYDISIRGTPGFVSEVAKEWLWRK